MTVTGVTASEGAAIDVDAGSGADVLNVWGESLTFVLTDTGLTTPTRAPLTYAGVETLGLYSGVFQVPAPAAVSADVRVDAGGVLAGVGRVSGAVTVNAEGTISPGEDGPDTLHVSDTVFTSGKKFAVDYAFDGDGDGQFNDVALIAYGAALGPDPCEPGKTALFVSATAGDDLIR